MAPAVLSFFVPDSSQTMGFISGEETLACLALSPASLQWR